MAVKLNNSQKEIIQNSIEKPSEEKVLEVSNLVISFRTDNGKVQAVRGVSFDLHKGETLCIVGESGSGKSVTSKAIMGILSPNAIVEGGQIIYQGEDLMQVSEEEYHRIRGHRIGMIFQDPLSSLNPIVKIGKQITETLLINSNQLKNYYDELIANELTAFANAKVVRNSRIRKANREFDELKDELNKKISALEEELSKAKSEAKKEAGLTRESSSNPEAIKAELESVKAEKKSKLAEASTKKKEEIALAKEEYQQKAPGLKEALKKKKAEAKVETKKHAEDLKNEYEVKEKEIDAKLASIQLNEQEQKELNEAEKRINQEKLAYYCLFALNYFFNKHKQILRAKHLAKMQQLLAEREAIHGVKEMDALKKEKADAFESYRSQIRITKAMAKKKALDVMREVGIPEPEKRFKQYPFQFSGGMRQRIVIAIALIAEPHILICDEPTTALDVTIQAQILELINKLKATHQMSIIFITHDLGVVANMADRVAVMYAGKIVEYGTDKEIFFDPRHPYTWALLSSIPDIDSKEKLEAIPGTPPDMIYPPVGDAFAVRNKYALGIDFKYEPPYFEITPTHKVATWLEYDGAPDVEPPKIVSERIYKALNDEGELIKNEKR
ncbi:MAG: ATP-binding cassette domain-containing protein [Bacilli bacterium]|nr:ATP-binding cassette domain-containing protein [Bacilli bacterium]